MNSAVLILAERRMPNAGDSIRRYCGLPWSGGPPEVWAYPYFDAVPTDSFDVAPVDVLAAAALHPKLTRSDLVWFADHRDQLHRFLGELPNASLGEVDPSVLDRLPGVADGIDLSLLTKVLHRKRPALIPMLDRSLVDWYRHHLNARGAAAWPELVRALAADLRLNEDALRSLRLIAPLTDLRIADISIWMENRR